MKELILPVLSLVLTSLASWAVGLLIQWMNTKIKDQTLAKHATAVTQIITDAVMSVFQTFVETLKANDKFDAAAQAEAKQRAMDIILNQLTPELKSYIVDNYGELTSWISTKIETVIYSLKK